MRVNRWWILRWKNRIVNEIEEYENKIIELNRDDSEILYNLLEMVKLFVELIKICKTAYKEKKDKNYFKNGDPTKFEQQKRL